MDVHAYWDAVLRQDAAAMEAFLHPDAVIRWPNTNEQFTAEEFIRANCAYPNNWEGEVELIEQNGALTITVTRVRAADLPLSFHAISFITLRGDKIASISEFWSDDGDAPKWRRDMRIGRPLESWPPQLPPQGKE